MELKDGRVYDGVERAISVTLAVANPDMAFEIASRYIEHLNEGTWLMLCRDYAPIIRANPHLLREQIEYGYDMSTLVKRARGEKVPR